MPSFAIEIYRPGVSESWVQELVRGAKRTVAALVAEGVVVRYVGCTLSPTDEVCFLRLEGDAARAIAQVAERLALQDARITEMIDLAEG